jgi:hypothetical protein
VVSALAGTTANRPLSRQKKLSALEQGADVAAPSQLRTVGAPSLPPSNQTEATLFLLMSQRHEWGFLV